MVNWNESKKRKDFREALSQVYPNETDLKIFVDETLNENLAKIAGGGNLREIIFNLVDWAKGQGRLDELYQAFKDEKPQHAVIATLEQQSFVLQVFNLSQEDWSTLFRLFLPDDLADLKRAFEQGFKKALGITFKEAQGQAPPLVELTQIREQLERYDANPKGRVLAVRFVECAIAELRRSNESNDRDLTALEAWRDRIAALEAWRDAIAQKYNIPREVPELPAPNACHAYLLVALKERGRVTQEGEYVNVFVELRVTGELTPIELEASFVACTFDQVAGHVSNWIREAEKALIPYEGGRVTLELFLPCVYLEENIAAWEVQPEQGSPLDLGMYRGFVVRSLERVLNRTTQTVLKQKWRQLENYVSTNNAYDRFHLQEDSPAPGALLAFLEDSLGLRLVARLPSDREQRKALLYDIINSAVPIALWSTEFDQFTTTELKTQVDHLLQVSQLTNFADLAKRWRIKRAEPDNGVIKNIRLLCDCPDRWPTLPDSRPEDACVS